MLVLGASFLLLCNTLQAKLITVNAADFGIKPGEDAVPGLRRALQACRQTAKIRLIFPPGRYDFYPQFAAAKFCAISNNDNGYKRMAFPLLDFHNLEIDGGGAEFIFHGRIVPFVIEGSSNLKIHNFSIDWQRPFNSEAVVIGGSKKNQYLDLQIYARRFPYKIVSGELIFCGPDWEEPIGQNIIFDHVTKAPIYDTKPYRLPHKNRRDITARELRQGVVRIFTSFSKVPPIGSILICKGLQGTNRQTPGFRIYNTRHLECSNIDLHHAGCMGLIAEKCDNITLDNFNVVNRKDSKRYLTTTADATHFVNCQGLIKIVNCTFEHMLDDAANIHGCYLKVTKVIDRFTRGFETNHWQQTGFDFAAPGDEIRFVGEYKLLPICTAIVKTVRVINEKYREVTFTSELPASIDTSCAGNNITWMPSLEFKNNIVRENRARSLLVTTPRPVLIENNRFSSMMSAILIEGDTHVWFESGQVEDVIIRNNYFGDMGYGGFGPILMVSPKIKADKRHEGYYHRNIVFENNTINTFDKVLVKALSVKGLIFRNNSITQSGSFAPLNGDKKAFILEKCSNVLFSGNKFYGSSISTEDINADSQCEGIELQ